MEQSRTRRSVVAAGVVAASMLALAACGLGGSSEKSNGKSGGNALTIPTSGKVSWCGTISMYAQEYTPQAKVANTLGLSAMKDAADGYTKAHPCIKISFVDDKFQDNIATIRAKAAAGNLFDVFWAQWTSFQGQLPKGVAYDLQPAMDKPSPYAKSFDTWAASMNERIINETKAGDGASYNVNGDFVATGWYYNKDLFAKAGVTAVPKTWSEFTAVCKKLKAAGVVPVAYVPYYGWMARPFLSNIYGNDYKAITDLDGKPGYSTSDEAIATANGVLSPKDKRFTSWWPAFKEASQTWDEDFITAAPDKNYQAEQDFEAGKAAMYFNGSYYGRKLKGSGVKFGYDVFSFPTVDKGASPYATDVDPGDTVGGPSGAFQYAISTPNANRSMKEKGKALAVLDWVRYFTTPEQNEKIVNETGEFLPVFAGTKPLPDFASVADSITKPAATIQVGYTVPSLDNDDQRIFGSYLAGQLSLKEAQAQLQSVMDKAAKTFVTQNKLQSKVK